MELTQQSNEAAPSREAQGPPPIEMRSEEVDEILGKPASWLLRSGSAYLLLFIVLILLFSWWIKYPDRLAAAVVITTEVPPALVVARTNGEIQVTIQDQEWVEKGTTLAIITNPASSKDVFYLEEQLARIEGALYSSQIIPEDLLHTNLELGELQNPFSRLRLSLKEYALSYSINNFEQGQLALSQSRAHYLMLRGQLKKQEHLQREALLLKRKNWQRDSMLFATGVQSALETERSQADYLAQQQAYENLVSAIIKNDLEISALEGQSDQLELDQATSSQTILHTLGSHLHELQSSIQHWRQSYVITAPIDGKISLFRLLKDHQYVKQDEEIMSVVPANQRYYGLMQCPAAGAGKIKLGQPVNIRLDNYPASEYGMIKGQVERISLLPKDGMYLIRVQFDQDWSGSFNRPIPLLPEMTGAAEIITEDLRLLERFFYRVKELNEAAL